MKKTTTENAVAFFHDDSQEVITDVRSLNDESGLGHDANFQGRTYLHS